MPHEILLPWPDKGLSPNARLHWARLAKLKAAAREEAFSATKAAIPLRLRQSLSNGTAPIPVLLTFTPPDKRPRDRDNMQYAMKAALDGVADALGVNDRRFQPTYAFNEPAKPGQVEVAL